MAKDANKQVNDIMKAFNKRINDIKGNTRQGIEAAGWIFIREAQEHVPVEHGFLKASAFCRPSRTNDLGFEIGFSAAYAAPLEVKDMKHAGDPRPSGLGVFWGPDGHSFFLALAIVDRWSDAFRAIKQRASQ